MLTGGSTSVAHDETSGGDIGEGKVVPGDRHVEARNGARPALMTADPNGTKPLLQDCRVTVVTDALSPEGYFPIWHKYYSREFGSKNIVLVTYAGMACDFSEFQFRNVVELDGGYNDDRRLSVINQLGLDAVTGKNWLVRADADELLVADPRRFRSLRHFISCLDVPYVTAQGFDVVQSPSENALDFSRPIVLAQRRFAFALAALNKTCVTSVPLHWGRGFHYCSAYPRFSGLYMFHLKRCDIQFQKTWAKYMINNIKDDDYAKAYYETSVRSVDAFHKQRFDLPIAAGEAFYNRQSMNARFFGDITANANSGVFDGQYAVDDENVEIPEDFRGVF